MKRRVFLKNFLPLISALLGAFIFFTSYNRYLLDSTLVNLKVSLRELDKAETLDEAREIKDILDSAFLMETTKEEFDLASALKMEMPLQVLEEIPSEQQAKNTKYIESMKTQAEIDAASDIIADISKRTQIDDAKYFIKEVIAKKKKGKPFLVSKLEDIIIAACPSKERGELKDLRKVIEKIKKKAVSYSGEKLQAEYLKIAQLYLRIKDYGSSLAYINKTIEVNPESPLALTAQFYSGILHKARKDFKKAQVVFSEIKNKLPAEWEAFSSYQEAGSLYALGETEKAITLLKENFDQDPSRETRQLAQFRAGYIYFYNLDDLESASREFEKLSQKAKGSRLAAHIAKKIKKDMAYNYSYKGYRLLKEGYLTSDSTKYRQALEKFDLALKQFSNLDLAYSGKALAYNLLEESQEALTEIRKLEGLSSTKAEARAIAGFIYYNLGMTDKAISEYETALKIDPNLNISYYNLATLYLENKNYPQAKKYFKKAIQTDHSFPYSYNNLGYIFWFEGDYKQAEQLFRKAIALESAYVEPIYNLGVILSVFGHYEEAKKLFEEVETLKPGYRRTAYYLKRIKEKLGY